jgi:hypothetical protein
MSEVAHHQTQAHLWKELDSTLCDLAFIETKCTSRLRSDVLHAVLRAYERRGMC